MRTQTKKDTDFVSRRLAEHANKRIIENILTKSEIEICVAIALVTKTTTEDVEAALVQAKKIVADEGLAQYVKVHNEQAALHRSHKG